MYTIMVAAMDRNVVAVDAMADNLAYISKSLNIINKTEKVVLVHNPIRYICNTTYSVTSTIHLATTMLSFFQFHTMFMTLQTIQDLKIWLKKKSFGGLIVRLVFSIFDRSLNLICFRLMDHQLHQ